MGSKVTLAVSDGTSMSAYTARPGWSLAPKAGLILSQEAFGVNAHMRDVAERLAAEGYLVVAPELFHRTAPGAEFGYDNFDLVKPHYGAMTIEGLEADLRAACLWLQSEGAKSIGAIGFCLGGRASFLANAILPLKCAVSFYGGGIAPALLDRAKAQNSPILFFWGGKDAHIPAESRNAIKAAMHEAKKPFVDVEFGAADHGFFRDVGAKYDPAAAAEAWALTKEFLKRNLA